MHRKMPAWFGGGLDGKGPNSTNSGPRRPAYPVGSNAGTTLRFTTGARSATLTPIVFLEPCRYETRIPRAHHEDVSVHNPPREWPPLLTVLPATGSLRLAT